MRVMTIETAGTLCGVPIDLIAETVRLNLRQYVKSKSRRRNDAIIPIDRLRRIRRVPAHVRCVHFPRGPASWQNASRSMSRRCSLHFAGTSSNCSNVRSPEIIPVREPERRSWSF
jgi:hypothetical protein